VVSARTTRREAEGRHITRAVRRAYSGPITYGANMGEVFDAPVWDALDFIGVSAYWPLVDAPSPERHGGGGRFRVGGR